MSQRTGDTVKQFSHREWLVQRVYGAKLFCGCQRVCLAKPSAARDRDNPGVRAFLKYFDDGLSAALFGHDHVGDNQFRQLCVVPGNALDAIFGYDHGVTLHLKGPCNQVADVGIVVDDKYLGHSDYLSFGELVMNGSYATRFRQQAGSESTHVPTMDR